MAKPTEADRERFRSLVGDAPGVEVKPMFGNLGAFVNGNMYAGLFGSAVGVKLADADREELAAAGAGPFGPEERPMGSYLSLPAALAPSEASAWVDRAREHVATFPPKTAKAKARRAS